MGRQSTIDKLPGELRELFNRLVRDGHTIVQITEKLNELDADVTQSAIGRSVKVAREQMKVYKDAQEVAGVWVQDLHENPKGDVGMLLAEMLKSLAYQSLSQMAESNQAAHAAGEIPKPTKPMDLMLLAKTVKDLEATSKQSIERREKIKQLVLADAVKKTREVGTRLGVSPETLKEIEHQLGLL